MTNVEKALATQLANMETRTGKSLAELSAIVQGSGLTKHGEVVKMLKATLGMGHGDATTLVHHVRSGGPPTTIPSDSTADGAVLDGLYVGPKAALRPIHDAILAGLQGFGPFEVSRRCPPARCASTRYASPIPRRWTPSSWGGFGRRTRRRSRAGPSSSRDGTGV